MHSNAVEEFLVDVAGAVDVTDINIAAGVALQRSAESRRRSRSKRARGVVGLALAAVVATIVIGDSFASSPVQAGIVPWPHAHVLTRIGLPTWETKPGDRARIFNEKLPWSAHDGWLARDLEKL